MNPRKILGEWIKLAIGTCASITLIISPATSQAEAWSPIEPESILEIWTFDNESSASQASGWKENTLLSLFGEARTSADASGRTGLPGDRSLDFGTSGSTTNPTHARLDPSTPDGHRFLSRLNESNSNDTLSVTFWQKWRNGLLGNSSSVWFASPSAGSGDRGFQAHLPWGNGTVYFDTMGCCDSPGTRLSGTAQINSLPIPWETWTHIALIKNKGAKQVWINGQLVLDQASGASPLSSDWNALYLGQSSTEPEIAFHGWMDDVALFSVALTESQIQALANGLSPIDLALPRSEWPPQLLEISPPDGTEFFPPNGEIRFRVVSQTPTTLPLEGIQFYLNEINQSDHLVFEGTSTDRTIRFQGPLQPNQTYQVRVDIRDSIGRENSKSWTFNTLQGPTLPEFGILRAEQLSFVQFTPDKVMLPADLAVDGDFSTFCESDNVTGSFWILTSDRPRPIQRLELINRRDSFSPRLQGLLVEVLDETGAVVASDRVGPTGPGETWTLHFPDNSQAFQIRIGLPVGEQNGAGDFVVTLAEVFWFTGQNFAEKARSYMMRFSDSLPPTEYGNDGNYNTYVEGSPRAVGSYFEVDLGLERALYQVRVIAPDGFQSRMTHTTVRVYDGNHDSVFSEHLKGSSAVFDVDLPGPVFARYVRVGFENKERSESGTFWHLGLTELQALGRPLEEVGILHFEAESSNLNSGESTQLLWLQEDLQSLILYPSGMNGLSATNPSGEGTVPIRPDVTTEYTLVGTLHERTQVRYFTVTIDGTSLPPIISEIVSANRLSLDDAFGESPDWIEIRNPNPHPISLGGYGLSDRATEPMKWVFPPDVVLEEHGYLLVHASGRNESYDTEGRLHASFTLEREGVETLVLSTPDGTPLNDSSIPLPPLTTDLAYARTLTGEWAFLEPTPGMANLGTPYVGWLESVTFSHLRGFYEQSFHLTLTHPDPDAEIWISLDGGASERLYTGTLPIEESTSVQVQVRKKGFKSPALVTHTYLFPESTLASSNMNQTLLANPDYLERARKGLLELPTFSVTVSELPDDWDERPASVELFLPGQEPIHANAGFERFGGSWTEFAKKNYRLKFRRTYGTPKLEAPLFEGFDHGIPVVSQFDEIDLRGGGHDMSSRGFYMSARFTEDTLLEMGSLNPHGRFVNLYINGVYWGQYHARERLTDSFLADYLGGSKEDYTNVRGNDNEGDGFVPGTPDPLHREPWLTALSLRGDYEKLKSWVDIPHLIDFMLMWNFGNAESEYRAAGPTQLGSGFKFWLGDADGFLRSPSDRTANAGPGDLFGGLVAEGHPDFMTLLADRTYQHLFHGGALTPQRNALRLQTRMDEIANSLVAESARWGYRTPDSWEAAARNALDNLFPNQTQSLLSRLRTRGLYPVLDAPELSQHGGVIDGETTLEIQAKAGTIYYTLDGSDPRLPGGEVAPQAIRLGNISGNALTEPKAIWNYLDTGTEPPGNWTTLIDPGSAWFKGPAPLGYGDSGMGTTLRFGGQSNNKFIAYYFHRTFNIPDLSQLDQVTLLYQRDDGVALYLNGRELFRDNLPEGILSPQTLALSAVGGSDEALIRQFEIPKDLLLEGTNVLAAEVHQASGNSSDLRFDAWIETAQSLSLSLKGGDHFKGRTYDGSTWSALANVTFLSEDDVPPDPGEVVISEICYNPDGDDAYEFIELLNTGTRELNLSGLLLSGAVNFTFPEGTRLAPQQIMVITENRVAFQSRFEIMESDLYFPGIHSIGDWSGRLSDGGEQVDLTSSDGTLLVSVFYDDENEWPSEADGAGSSLELIHPFEVAKQANGQPLLLNQAGDWRASRLYQGSPGRLDNAFPLFGIAIEQGAENQTLIITLTPGSPGRYLLESTDSVAGNTWITHQVLDIQQVLPITIPIPLDKSSPTRFYRIQGTPQ